MYSAHRPHPSNQLVNSDSFPESRTGIAFSLNGDPTKWGSLLYVDEKTGKKYRLLDARSKDKRFTSEKLPVPKRYETTLRQFMEHPESKFAGSDQEGLLERWHVHATEVRILGKEVERKRQEGEMLGNLIMKAEIEYIRRPTDRKRQGIRCQPLPPRIIEKLKQHQVSIKRLCRELQLDRNAVRRALRRKPVKRETQSKLIYFAGGV
jgi:hypothetical protein